jgi:hypothetical protein
MKLAYFVWDTMLNWALCRDAGMKALELGFLDRSRRDVMNFA